MKTIARLPFLSSCRNFVVKVVFCNPGALIVHSEVISKFNIAGSFVITNEPAISYLFSLRVCNAIKGLTVRSDPTCSTVHKALTRMTLLVGAVTVSSIPLVPKNHLNGDAAKASSLYPYVCVVTVRSPLLKIKFVQKYRIHIQNKCLCMQGYNYGINYLNTIFNDKSSYVMPHRCTFCILFNIDLTNILIKLQS